MLGFHTASHKVSDLRQPLNLLDSSLGLWPWAALTKHRAGGFSLQGPNSVVTPSSRGYTLGTSPIGTSRPVSHTVSMSISDISHTKNFSFFDRNSLPSFVPSTYLLYVSSTSCPSVSVNRVYTMGHTCLDRHPLFESIRSCTVGHTQSTVSVTHEAILNRSHALVSS